MRLWLQKLLMPDENSSEEKKELHRGRKSETIFFTSTFIFVLFSRNIGTIIASLRFSVKYFFLCVTLPKYRDKLCFSVYLCVPF